MGQNNSYYDSRGPYRTPEEIAAIQRARAQNDARGRRNEALKDQGYELKARPYDFNAAKFRDPNYGANKKKLQRYEESFFNRRAPRLDMGQMNQSRRMSLGALRTAGQGYQDVLSGNAPSVAQLQLQQGRDANINAAMAMANSARGGNFGAAQRAAQMQSGDMNQQMAGQASMLRAQEQDMARQGMMNLGQQYANVRGQDIGVQGLQAQTQLQNQAMNDQMVNQFVQMGMSNDQAQWAAQMELERQRAQQHQAAQATLNGIGASDSPSPWWSLAGAGIGALGAVFAKSDRRAKTEIKGSKKDIEQFLSKLKPYKYKYKQGEYGEGKQHYGIMAQDLEKSDVGKSFVINTPHGKMVHSGLGFGAVLAAQKMLHDKVKKLEAKRG